MYLNVCVLYGESEMASSNNTEICKLDWTDAEANVWNTLATT